MKKLNFIIGKRQIMISTLLLILAVAAYLNWQFATNEQSISVMDVLNPKKAQISPQSENSETNNSNYGEAELVSNEVQSEIKTDYFTQAKMQKDASHAEAREELQKAQNLPNISQETKTEAEKQNLNLATTEKQEKAIEDQVRTLFDDCIAYVTNQNTNNQDVSETKVNVVIKAKNENIDSSQIAKIKDIVVKETGAKPINTTITPA